MFSIYPDPIPTTSTAFGKDRTSMVNYLLFVVGNTTQWKKGTLVGGQMFSRPVDWDHIYTVAAKFSKGGNKALGVYPEDLDSINGLANPAVFESISSHSRISDVPLNVTDAWLATVAHTFLLLFHIGEGNAPLSIKDPSNPSSSIKEDIRSNHNARVLPALFLKYNSQFKSRAAWTDVIAHPEILGGYYKGSTVWDMYERRQSYLGQLRNKAHGSTTEYGVNFDPFNKLSTAEYLDYFYLDATNHVGQEDLIKSVYHRQVIDRIANLNAEGNNRVKTAALMKAIGLAPVDGKHILLEATPELLAYQRRYQLFAPFINSMASPV